MNLGKRASLLILPVILLSYAVVALFAYQHQSESIQKLEQDRLQQRLNQLSSVFNTYSTFADAYLISLLESDILKNYFQEPDNIYRTRILSSNLEDAIKRYHPSTTEYASLTIINEQHIPVFYIENSTDPFATAKSKQIQTAKSMKDKQLKQHWLHLYTERGSEIIQGTSIDLRTLEVPLHSQYDKTSQVIVTVKPSRFDQLLEATREEYTAVVTFNPEQLTRPLLAHQLQASTKLYENHLLQITTKPRYLLNKFHQLRNQLFLVAVIATLITYGLLQLLIRRFITDPIAKLDDQLNAVIEKQRQNIDYLETNDELGRLGRKFHNLYQQLHEAFQESHKQSRTDSLTQLPNRIAFYEFAVTQLVEYEKRQIPVSILYIDLDNFKFVNDKYGHEVGDQLLKAVALRLNRAISLSNAAPDKNMPLLCRLSGDEFILLLPGSDIQKAEIFGDKILHLFANGFSFELGHFPVTASIGIASYPADGHTLSQLVSNADLAMYQAKKTGKNKRENYSQDLAKKDRKQKEIESILKSVNCDEEFELHYMPIVTLKGHIKSCEALLRWESPLLGPVSPALFIPIAENIGLFETIDLWVIEQAFREFPALQSQLGEKIQLSINISSANSNSEKFIDELALLGEKHSITPQNFILEMTETFAPSQEKNVLLWLQRLREMGYQIAIDDFGTGYTSLMQMVNYPVDIIKFDKQLVERIAQGNQSALAQSLIDLCHLQGMTVVAEGIETQEQNDLLCSAGCDFLQGYLIAKPMPLGMLQDWKKTSPN